MKKWPISLGWRFAISMALGCDNTNGHASNSDPLEFPQMTSAAVMFGVAASPTVLSSPKIVPVFFASDDPSVPGQIAAFLSTLVASPYWASVVSEYGVGSASVLAPVQLTAADNPASNLVDDSQIQAWLAHKLSSNDPAWPAPDGNTIYTLFYPPGTTTTDGSFAYHEALQNTSAFYIFVPPATISAAGPLGALSISGFDYLTFATTHELVETATDPWGRGYVGWDADHAFWWDFLGQELADVCQFASSTKIANYVVPRIWSNKAAAAGADPCVPAPSGQVYFNSVPLVSESVSWSYPDSQTQVPAQNTKGIHIAVGQSATVEIDPFSAGPTSGAWSLSASDWQFSLCQAGQVMNSGPCRAQLQFSFDKASVQAGEKIHMTIHVVSKGPNNIEEFEVVSTLGSQEQHWFGIVGN